MTHNWKLLHRFAGPADCRMSLFEWDINQRTVAGHQPISVCDSSGDYPHETDDGILWLDRQKPIRFNGTYWSVPLIDAVTMDRCWTGCEMADIPYYMNVLGFDVVMEIGGKKYHLGLEEVVDG